MFSAFSDGIGKILNVKPDFLHYRGKQNHPAYGQAYDKGCNYNFWNRARTCGRHSQADYCVDNLDYKADRAVFFMTVQFVTVIKGLKGQG